MRTLIVNAVVGAAILSSAGHANGQGPKYVQTIEVCGIDLKPGMAKDAALKAVATTCESKHVSAYGPEFDELWFLRTAHKPNENWSKSLYFLGGLLVTISKDIGNADNNAAGR
jgi:hypothetical protein